MTDPGDPSLQGRLEAACVLYERWYRGEIASLDGACCAYVLVSAIRQALHQLREATVSPSAPPAKETNMERLDVFSAIAAERDYQAQKWGDLDDHNGIADFLLYMRRELAKADVAFIGPGVGASDADALAAIRKVTTIGVAAMEKFGTGTPR